MINNIISIISMMFMYSTPLVFGALAGVISERAGVVNIGIEGMMTIGAFFGSMVGYYTKSPWLGFLAGGLAAALFSVLHAVASISFNADQTISGIALNLIGPGLAVFLCRIFFSDQTFSYPLPVKIPKVFSVIDATVLVGIFLTLVMYFVMYKTKWGLRIRAVGEHPKAADTLGVNVSKIRYTSVIISGFLAGLGGASVTLAIVSQFSPSVISGQGFIALAAVIFGKWTPLGSYGACLLFALAQALTINLGGVSHIPSEILNMFPYIITIVILILFVGKSIAPKASGEPYKKL